MHNAPKNDPTKPFGSGSISMNPDALMSEVQASQLLCISVRTLQGWRLRGGSPPYIKLGRGVRYRRRDLIIWMEDKTFVSTSQAPS
jgi:hypothetical protein